MYSIPPIICWKMVQASSSAILNCILGTCVKYGLLFALDDVVKQLATFHILHYEKKLFGGFDDLVQLDDVGMPDQLKDMYFPRNAFDISNVDYFFFFQDLYCYFFSSGDVGG